MWTQIKLTLVASPDSAVEIPCPDAVMSRDTVRLRCPDSPLGTLSVEGTFLDKRGNFAYIDDRDLVERKAVALVGLVSIVGSPEPPRLVRFKFWEGD